VCVYVVELEASTGRDGEYSLFSIYVIQNAQHSLFLRVFSPCPRPRVDHANINFAT